LKKKILITGINGFLGSHLAKRLSTEYDIVGLVRNLKNINRIESYNYQLVQSTEDSILKLFNENSIYAVIHTATVYRVDKSVENLINTNVLLPIKLYEQANSNGVSLFFNTDTFFNSKEVKQDYLPQYTLSKKNALEWLKLIQGDCKLVNMKLFHMFGSKDSPLKFTSKIFTDLINNIPNIDLTSGEQKRDFIHVEDVVDAYLAVLNNFIPDNKHYAEYEVGTGTSISIKTFVQTIKNIVGTDTVLNFGALKNRENEIMDAYANNMELKKIGWIPKYDIEKGIKEILVNGI
jgi:nucleoside-diphosphate-sugar epimerase